MERCREVIHWRKDFADGTYQEFYYDKNGNPCLDWTEKAN